jgi:hypothetical protein
MDNFIQEIRDNLTRKNYLSALALSLTLPDICGKIAYPDMKNKKGYPDIGGRYAKWYNKNIYVYENPPYEKQMDPLDGKAVYKLRCMFLHEGSNDIKEFLKKESTENFSEYKFIFTDSITRISSHWPQGKEDQKTIDIQINIVYFCQKICWTAEIFYKEHAKKNIFKNIIFSTSKGDYKNEL